MFCWEVTVGYYYPEKCYSPQERGLVKKIIQRRQNQINLSVAIQPDLICKCLGFCWVARLHSHYPCKLVSYPFTLFSVSQLVIAAINLKHLLNPNILADRNPDHRECHYTPHPRHAAHILPLPATATVRDQLLNIQTSRIHLRIMPSWTQYFSNQRPNTLQQIEHPHSLESHSYPTVDAISAERSLQYCNISRKITALKILTELHPRQAAHILPATATFGDQLPSIKVSWTMCSWTPLQPSEVKHFPVG